MTWSWLLGVNSNTAVTIYPEFNMMLGGEKIESRSRSQDGSEYVYKYGSYTAISFGVNFVSSTDAAMINSWWVSNTALVFLQINSAGSIVQTHSVHIINRQKPIASFRQPYIDQYTGQIELSTY